MESARILTPVPIPLGNKNRILFLRAQRYWRHCQYPWMRNKKHFWKHKCISLTVNNPRSTKWNNYYESSRIFAVPPIILDAKQKIFFKSASGIDGTASTHGYKYINIYVYVRAQGNWQCSQYMLRYETRNKNNSSRILDRRPMVPGIKHKYL